MKPKAIIPLVLGLCVGLVAVKVLVDTLKKARGSTSDAAAITVVRARQDIDSYQELTPDLVEVVKTVDTTLAPAGQRITSVEDLTGRVTAKTIPQHSPILESMLAPLGTPAGMVGRIPPGFRAVSVRIDEVTGVAYQLKPGDWVDVIVVMDVDTGGRRKETVAEVILQHVQVAAIGQTTAGQSGESGQKAKPAKSATLLVCEDDVPKLHLAATRGKLTLAMRGEDDQLINLPAKAREGEIIRPETAETAKPSGPAGGFLGAFLAHMVPPRTEGQLPPPKPEADPRLDSPHGIIIYHDSMTGNMQVEQVVFENARSRKVVALVNGPINRMESKPARGSWLTPSPARFRSAGPDRGEAVLPEDDSDSELEEVK